MATIKHNGTFEELKAKFSSASGSWEDKGNEKRFISDGKGIATWWQSTKTITFSGQSPDKENLKTLFETSKDNGQQRISGGEALGTKIFIVHGHDTDSRDQLELVLRRLGLEPYILQNSDSKSQTIIEALENNLYTDSAFGIVLLTPDDYGYSKEAGEIGRNPRARQNVILEMGMLLAKLGRKRIAIVKKGALELPSDIDGLLRLEYNTNVKEVAQQLALRIQGAGIEIDSNKIPTAAA